MIASLRALLTDLIDYAGLFPPARLPLDQAIRNYARYRQEDDAWMLGRFVIPTSRLEDLELYQEELFRVDPPFAFSVLGRGGGNLTEFLTNLRQDLRDIAVFRKRHGNRVTVDVLETRLPPDLCDPSLPESALTLYKTLGIFPVINLLPFCEPAGQPEQLLELFAQLPGDQIGFKFRSGGLEPSAFPSSDQVAAVLHGCLDSGVSFKATAGLHHPLPRRDDTIQARMHGFINVFLAGVLLFSRNLPLKQIGRLLDDDQADHFTFTNKGASWLKYRVSTAEIATARRDFMRSFGSCSLDEPREDLRALGWM
ncbi:MAG TPA: hypothetical protein VH592_24550 [Gemmataceae bacterium]